MHKKLFATTVIIILVLTAAGGLFYLYRPKKPVVINTDTNKDQQKLSTEIAFDNEEVNSDPIGDQNGPYFHKVYSATSSDGINFTKTGNLIADHASVPDIVAMQDGKLFFYAVDGAGRSDSGLLLGMSEDNGKTWELGSVQLTTSGKGKDNAVDPQVVLLDDGRVRLYYLFNKTKLPLDAKGVPIVEKGISTIRSAVSTDGINFIEEEGYRYEIEETFYTDPDVIKIGSKWYMYLSKGQTNVAFVSDDGLSFTKEKAVRDDGAISKTIQTGPGVYRQYYCKDGITSAETTDGLAFTDEALSLKDNEGNILCDPSPLKISDTNWFMIYKLAKPNNNMPPPPKP